MCDLFSWIKDAEGKIWFNTDEDIKIAGLDLQNGIGHSAIEKIWKVKGKHIEGVFKVPKEIAAAVNAGKCDQMIREARWSGLRYTRAGCIKADWWPKKLIAKAKKLRYFDNHGPVDPAWRIFDTWAAARDAARAAAGDAAWDAAGDAAWAAARAAALFARCLVAWGADAKNEHINYARKRWVVYEAGYGVVCDVDGVFYVYRRP